MTCHDAHFILLAKRFPTILWPFDGRGVRDRMNIAAFWRARVVELADTYV
jgi:hypothetical protein